MLTRWQPFGDVRAELNRLHHEMNRLFGRYSNGVRDLSGAFPPLNLWEDDGNLYVEAELPGFTSDDIEMYVTADNQLSLRTGISASIIPNVMDFDNPPSPVDDYSSDIRQAFGIEDDQLLILQPTRVVGRKGIEHSIELVKRLGMKARLVITHASVDEGHDYEMRVKEYAKIMNVDTVFESDIIKQRRGKSSTGNKIYSLFDVYPHADLVTYPSGYEGFGNAFLEAVYFRKPMVVNLYSIYETDIKPKGFRAIELPGYVDDKVLADTREIINNPELCEKIVEHNYKLGKRYYSYSVLQRKLKNLLFDMFGS